MGVYTLSQPDRWRRGRGFVYFCGMVFNILFLFLSFRVGQEGARGPRSGPVHSLCSLRQAPFPLWAPSSVPFKRLNNVTEQVPPVLKVCPWSAAWSMHFWHRWCPSVSLTPTQLCPSLVATPERTGGWWADYSSELLAVAREGRWLSALLRAYAVRAQSPLSLYQE